MGALKLELPCAKSVDGISADPEPDWNFDDVLSELNSLDLKLGSSQLAFPFTKVQPRNFPNGKSSDRNSRPFVMRVFEDDVDDGESEEEEEEEEVLDRSSVVARHFKYDDLNLSESEDELGFEAVPVLMEAPGLVEGALSEYTFEHKHGVEEDIRNKICEIETRMKSENEKSTSARVRIEKYQEARRENDKKLDTQYQRKIAEALDNHLTAIQRDHELKSQIEERKISAAIEVQKRKEKALLEEKLRQEKAKAEAEAKLRADEAKKAALEAQKRAEKEAAEREAAEAKNRAAAKANADEASRQHKNSGLEKKNSAFEGDIIRAAESALKLEQERLKKLQDIDEESKRLGLSTNKEYNRLEKQISKLVQQISATRDVVRKKATDLVQILKSSPFPQSVSIRAFARKVIPNCKFSSTAFARAYVIVLVSSEVPQVMDVVLAELHRACIYTVPKHIMYSKSAFQSNDEYYKAIGFKEDEGKLEDVDSFVKQIESYIKLYGALVQTEIPGIQNPHSLKDGWAWIARFLNSLPANRYTAVALSSFLDVAGYALFRKYKSQFGKILIIVLDHFVNALKERKDATLNEVITNIQTYVEDRKFRQEPEGRSLEASLLSEDVMTATNSNYHSPYYNNGYNNYGY